MRQRNVLQKSSKWEREPEKYWLGESDGIVGSENSREDYVMNMRNPITFKNTITDVNKVVSWLQSKNETRNFCDIPPGQLNAYLAQFFKTANKQNRDQYEPDTLKSVQCSINRSLDEKSSTVSIIEDRGSNIHEMCCCPNESCRDNKTKTIKRDEQTP